MRMVSVPIAKSKHAEPPAIVWRAVLSAFCTSLIGIGLARFAYTPLLPAIIGAHWFEPAAAAYLGAANLAGYLLGALSGRPLSARMPLVVVLRTMMLLATATFFACAYPVGFAWFFVWRFVAGVAGGALMVLAAPNVLPHVPASRRGACRRRDLHGRRRRDRDLRHARAAPACAGASGDVVRTRSGVAASDARRMERVAARVGARGVCVRPVSRAEALELARALRRVRAQRGRLASAHGVPRGLHRPRTGRRDKDRVGILGDLRPWRDGWAFADWASRRSRGLHGGASRGVPGSDRRHCDPRSRIGPGLAHRLELRRWVLLNGDGSAGARTAPRTASAPSRAAEGGVEPRDGWFRAVPGCRGLWPFLRLRRERRKLSAFVRDRLRRHDAGAGD